MNNLDYLSEKFKDKANLEDFIKKYNTYKCKLCSYHYEPESCHDKECTNGIVKYLYKEVKKCKYFIDGKCTLGGYLHECNTLTCELENINYGDIIINDKAKLSE